jgi:hypothetical protein
MAKAMPSAPSAGPRGTRGWLPRLALVAVGTALSIACGRTPIPWAEAEDHRTGGGNQYEGGSRVPPHLADAAPPPVTPDAGPVPTAAPTSTTEPPVNVVPRCTPVDEACNGKDDDCDGKVDNDLAPVPCAGGGAQYCVAGRFSACPTRCEACVPGSERVCFKSYCTYWAVEKCAADGRAFGACRERRAPDECMDIALKHKDSVELEQCCIDQGYCCRDDHDLDHDGVIGEMIGRCEEVSCEP